MVKFDEIFKNTIEIMDNKNRNYEIINNINEIYNNKIMNDLNNINNIKNKNNLMIDIYDKIESKEKDEIYIKKGIIKCSNCNIKNVDE